MCADAVCYHDMSASRCNKKSWPACAKLQHNHTLRACIKNLKVSNFTKRKRHDNSLDFSSGGPPWRDQPLGVRTLPGPNTCLLLVGGKQFQSCFWLRARDDWIHEAHMAHADAKD